MHPEKSMAHRYIFEEAAFGRKGGRVKVNPVTVGRVQIRHVGSFALNRVYLLLSLRTGFIG